MSTRTRRLVFLAALVAVLAIPAESVLLKALVTPSAQDAVANWVDGLGQPEFAAATTNIQHYPFAYRRELLRRESADGRSRVWRAHIAGYLAAHPNLDAAAVTLVKTAADVLTPTFFAGPSDEARASLHAVAEQIEASLGKSEAEYLLYRLGPADGTFASFEPLSMYLGNKVRGLWLNAASTERCNCDMYWGC